MDGGSSNVLEPVGNRKTFFSHVFSTTEEGKAELMNVVQYSLLGVIPIVLLNKLIQRFIPDADADKSSVEILIEVLIQLIVMFVGIIIIHRIITFVPTYSEFKYESLSLTNVILAFMILVLSIQTKIGIKVNILSDRAMELWTGRRENYEGQNQQQQGQQGSHAPTQPHVMDMTPPPPVITKEKQPVVNSGNNVLRESFIQEPSAANGVLGGGFGSFF